MDVFESRPSYPKTRPSRVKWRDCKIVEGRDCVEEVRLWKGEIV